MNRVGTFECKHLTPAYGSGPFLSDHLSEAVQHRDDRVAAVQADLIETRLFEIDCAAWRCDLIQVLMSECANVEQRRPASKRELCSVIFKRQHVQ